MLRRIKIILILAILLTNFASAVNYSLSERNVSYDQSISNLFNSIEKGTVLSSDSFDSNLKSIYGNLETFYNLNVKNNRVYVIVTLKDNSGVIFSGTKEERHKQWEIQNELYKNKVNNVLNNLSEKDIIIYGNSSIGFSGLVSKDGFEKLKNMSDIEAIELNYFGKASVEESVPLINADDVLNLGYGGSGVKVCVIDSGLKNDWSIVFNNISEEYCYCDHSILPGGCCPNGDTVDTSARKDETGHGTLDTGIIAANNRASYKGVAPNISLYIIKIMANNIFGENLYTNDDLSNAILKCIDWNVDVISFSGGGYDSDCSIPEIDNALNQVANNNIIFVASSGNGGHNNEIVYPACNPNVLSVGATYDANFNRAPETGNYPEANCHDSNAQTDDVTCFTDRSPDLNLLAPGYALGIVVPELGLGGILSMGGTSQAAPMVAGAAALLLEKKPTLTPSQIKDILNKTGRQIYDYPKTNLTFSRIDVLAAINSICICTGFTAGSCGGGNCSSSERLYTQTCNPSACDVESECILSDSCSTGGGGGGGLGSALQITVCASGCNYTTIQNAVVHSDANDKIFIMDSGTYAESVVMNSTSSGWLECKNKSKISASASKGIFLNHVDGPVVVGCTIEGYDYGIYLNSSHALIQNNTFINNGEAIRFWKTYASDNKIKYNNITGSSNYGIYLYSLTYSDGCVNNKIQNNFLNNSCEKEIYALYSQSTNIQNNKIMGGTSYGINLNSLGYYSGSTIYDNLIFNNGEGIYLQQSNQNTITNNTFCPSNTNVDIDNSGTGNNGYNNTCEKPGNWNDNGKTGCTYYCDSGASVVLLFPPNNHIDTDGNVDLVCQASDNYQLVNISLYHNISGIWQINQTRSISGTSNITAFNVNNLISGTNFSWNCLAYDNSSRGSFAPANWSVSIIINEPLPNDTSKFYIRDSTGSAVAWFGDLGNIVLKGNCFSGVNCNNPGSNSFIIKNTSNANVAFINSTGDLCIIKGDCSDESATCNPPKGAFIKRNSSDYNMSYIDNDGDLCLKGKLYENSEI